MGTMLLLLALAGCATRTRSVRVPHASFRRGRRILDRLAVPGPKGVPLYAARGGRGRILVRVRRAGPLAVFGHNHIVSSRWYTGLVRAGAHPGAVFCLPLANLSLDRPSLRRAAGAGFGGTLSPALRRATDRHMLESLRARRHPDLLLLVRPGRATPGAASTWKLAVILNGREVPVHEARLRVHETPAVLRVRARFRIRQTAFGLVPYNILAGGLRVRDTLAVRAQVEATRVRSRASLETLERGWCAFHPPHLGGTGT